jgi:hypothetical protein
VYSPVLIHTSVGRITTLCLESSVKVISAIGVNLILAVGLIVILALTAVQTRPDLGTSTDTVADLCERDLVANTKNLANDLVADSKRVRAFTPVSADGMAITGANTTALDLDVYIVLAKGTGLKRVLLEVGPVLGAGGLEALELIGDRHDDVLEMRGISEGKKRETNKVRING